jgi:hypothetical protein
MVLPSAKYQTASPDTQMNGWLDHLLGCIPGPSAGLCLTEDPEGSTDRQLFWL